MVSQAQLVRCGRKKKMPDIWCEKEFTRKENIYFTGLGGCLVLQISQSNRTNLGDLLHPHDDDFKGLDQSKKLNFLEKIRFWDFT